MTRCPGCGAEFPETDGPTHRYMESSPGCWAAYGEVLAREYSDPALLEVHRLSVDAYAAQHPGKPSQQSIQSVCRHLTRLFLLLEGGWREEDANKAMLLLGDHKKAFAWLEPPASPGPVTVADVLRCRTAKEHESTVRAWARSVLDAWSAHWTTLERWASLVKRP